MRVLVLALLFSVTASAQVFYPAVGDTRGLDQSWKRALTPGGQFIPYADWGQSVQEYRDFGPNRPSPRRKTIVLVPTTPVPTHLGELKTFLEAFFQLPVRIDPTYRLPPAPTWLRARTHKRSADQIQRTLLQKLPNDALSVIALTDVDLFAEDSGPDRLLFGQGHYFNRTAVASTNRLHTRSDSLRRHRLYKLVAHELLHTLGFLHCGYYRCLMNPSGSVSQSDDRPLHICPVCLRKLHEAIDFDPIARYQDLELAQRSSLSRDRRWTQARLRFLLAR